MAFCDITGKTFNRLTALRLSDRKGSDGSLYWDCKCQCGKETTVRSDAIRKGNIKSCGCMLALDIKGKRFHMLEVIERATVPSNKSGQAYWRCKCDCGKETITTTINLTSKGTKSCGCLRLRSGTKHPGFTGCEEIDGNYWNRIVNEAKRREIDLCLTVKDAWNLFEQQQKCCALTGFPLDMKRESRTASLDRIDSSKDYTLDNVQWVHKDINWLKGDFDQARFVALCKAVAKYAD